MAILTALPYGVSLSTGRRKYQHDRHIVQTVNSGTMTIYAVADGHGEQRTGHIVSDFVIQRLAETLQSHGVLGYEAFDESCFTKIRAAVRSLDESCISFTSTKQIYAGSTLCCVFRLHDSILCANVGDSRAILISCLPQSSNVHTVQLSRDHVCTDEVERERIERAGGVILNRLLNGYISMSRALGDEDLKMHRNLTPFPFPGKGRPYKDDLFIGDADVTQRPICTGDICTVVASDGLWNYMDNDDVAKVIFKSLLNGGNVKDAADAVVKRTLSKGGCDNITVVIGLLVPLHVAQSWIRSSVKGQRMYEKSPDAHSSTSTSHATDWSGDGDLSSVVETDSILRLHRKKDRTIRFTRTVKGVSPNHKSLPHHWQRQEGGEEVETNEPKYKSLIWRFATRIKSNQSAPLDSSPND